MIGLLPFGLPMMFGLSPFGLFQTTRTFRLQGHLDYRRLDYHRLDYFGLQGHLDYKDIWTTRTFGLPLFGLPLFALFWTTGMFGLQGHLDYHRLD